MDIDVSPDGTMLAAVHAENGQLQLYGLPSGKQLDAVRAHGGAVLDVEFSRDGRRVATGGVDGLARTWDVERRKAPRVRDAPRPHETGRERLVRP